jgi:pimeloyl-ACP methyl ester carboxylesterase
METFYKSPEGQAAIYQLYDEKLASLGIDYEEIKVDTDFGQTTILVTGPAEGPPLVLVHGSNAMAPIALETYPNLSKRYRVYAVDIPAQPNKSVGSRPSMKNNDYGNWMNQILAELALKDVILAGFSFGGLVILKTLLVDASRVKEVFLAGPAYIVNGNPLKALWKIFIPMRRYMKSGNKKFIEQFLDVLFTDRDPFAVNFLAKVFREFEMDFTPVPVISEADAQQITTPITLFAAKKDILFPGEKMIRRSSKIFRSLKAAILLEQSKHVQGRKDNSLIEDHILAVV